MIRTALMQMQLWWRGCEWAAYHLKAWKIKSVYDYLMYQRQLSFFPDFDFISVVLQPEDKELAKKAGSAWYKTMVSDSEYTEFENFTKWLGVSQ